MCSYPETIWIESKKDNVSFKMKLNLKTIFRRSFLTILFTSYILVSSVFGVLILSILLYKFSCELGLSQPLAFSELLLWIDNQSENTKTAIFTSTLTILGFLFAFNIGSAHQKQQFLSQMKIDAASDIETFFNEASRLATSANIYAKYLLEVKNLIVNGADSNIIAFHMHNVLNETQKYVTTRTRLQELAIEVHRFQGKYPIIFASTWGTFNKLNTAVDAFSNIANHIWFATPMLEVGDPNIAQAYTAQINDEGCNSYITSYSDNYLKMNEVTGGMRGALVASTTGINLPLIIRVIIKG